MRIFKTERARVSQQCRSAESKLVLTTILTGTVGKGKRLIFRYYKGTCGDASLVSDTLEETYKYYRACQREKVNGVS